MAWIDIYAAEDIGREGSCKVNSREWPLDVPLEPYGPVDPWASW